MGTLTAPTRPRPVRWRRHWIGVLAAVAVVAAALGLATYRASNHERYVTAADSQPAESSSPAGPSLPPPDAPSGAGQASGAYTYDVQGDEMTSTGGVHPVAGEGSLVVDPVNGTDQHMVLRDPSSSTETTLRYQSDGVYLVGLKLTTSVFTKEFRPDPPTPILSFPAAAGRAWSWTTRSVDGTTTLAGSFTINRGETVGVGAQSVPAWVLGVSFKLSGDMDALVTQTVWRSQDGRSLLRQRVTTEGSHQGTVFRSDVQSRLRSVSPA